eukprot:4466182-Pyramimonas_sp.AAC.1
MGARPSSRIEPLGGDIRNQPPPTMGSPESIGGGCRVQNPQRVRRIPNPIPAVHRVARIVDRGG